MKYNQKVKVYVCLLYDLGEKVSVISHVTQIPSSTIYNWLRLYEKVYLEKRREIECRNKDITITISIK